jgi:hypothetical protein
VVSAAHELLNFKVPCATRLILCFRNHCVYVIFKLLLLLPVLSFPHETVLYINFLLNTLEKFIQVILDEQLGCGSIELAHEANLNVAQVVQLCLKLSFALGEC